MNRQSKLGNVGVLMCFKMVAMVRSCGFITRLNKRALAISEVGNALFVEMLKVFRKPHEVTEAELLLNALGHKGTKITVTNAAGKCWVLCNDTAAECSVNMLDVAVNESKDKKDILIDFRVRAKNGRLG